MIGISPVAVCLDVDGVLNPDALPGNDAMEAAMAAGRMTGYHKTRVLVRGSTVVSPFLNENARQVLRLNVRHHDEHAVWITSMPARGAQPYWATTWERNASRYLSPVLGIPALPLACEYEIDLATGILDPSWADLGDAGQPLWKAAAITHRFAGRPVVWIDDKAIDLMRDEPTLVVRTEETVGLTRAQMKLVDEFIAQHAPRGSWT